MPLQSRGGLGAQVGMRAWGIRVSCCTNDVHSTCSYCWEQEVSRWKTTAFLSLKACIPDPDFYLSIHLKRKRDSLLFMAAIWTGQPAALWVGLGREESRSASVTRVACSSRAEAFLSRSQVAALWDCLQHWLCSGLVEEAVSPHSCKKGVDLSGAHARN